MKTFYAKLVVSTLLFLSGASMVNAQCGPDTQLGTFCTRSSVFHGQIFPDQGCGTFTTTFPYSPGTYFTLAALPGACYSVSTCGAGIDTQIGAFQGLATTNPFSYNDDNGPLCTGTAASINFVPTFNDYARIDVRQYNCQPGGSSSIAVYVRQNNNLTITSSAADMCAGQARSLTATPSAVIPFTGSAGNGGTFTGTGVSGTTFIAPTPAGLSQTYTITYTYGYCSTTQNITVYRNPSLANAGSDQFVCASSATLAGNTPTYGTGAWTIVSGPGSVTTPSSPTSTVTGLIAGSPTTFRWTITNGPCTTSIDDVVITRSDPPTTADAGLNQSVCEISTATMAANTPVVGTGTWSVIAGSGLFSSPNSPSSDVSNMSYGPNTYRWTITSGGCPVSQDDVVITRDETTSPSDAGLDQVVCSSSPLVQLFAGPSTYGTGIWTLVSGTGTVTSPSTPNSPVTGLGIGANTFRWTLTNGSCPSTFDDAVITVDDVPTTSNAGSDQTVCATTATLAGNSPSVGTGTWTLVGGSGTITTPSSPASGITGLGVGTNTFRWTIANGMCVSSTDDVVITREDAPPTSNAGPDQSICAATGTLAGNTPSVGTGTWTLIGGTGTITTPGSPSSGITGLGVGANTFRWTIANGMCATSTDDVVITRDDVPTISNAGPDQTVCAVTGTLAGNTPSVGTGTWTLVGGTGTITTPSSPTSGITGLGVGTNTFRWTIANGMCAASTDDVVITRDNAPTTSNAGPDQSICAATGMLAGNTPSVGTGTWTLIGGTGTITTPGSPSSGITGLGVGANTFRWTIANGMCATSTDDVVITRDDVPTTSNAGTDQTVCATTATLAGNTPSVGTGTWTLVGGTGTITTPSSPTSGITGLGVGTNTFRWTIANGMCAASTDDVVITRDNAPTTSNAGPDQTVCATTATLAGNAPSSGTGTWTLVSGAGTITTPSSPTSGITGLGVGANTFRWTISNGTCASSTDDVVITRDDVPTTSNAGTDQTVCATTATLAGNTPSVGTGTWTLVGGTGTITTPSSPISGITGLGVGTNTFRWTIANGMCATSIDDVVITRDDAPTTSNAGTDQTVCATTATLAGNAPSSGTGTWTLVSGAGTITTPSSPTSGITGLGVGANTFRWTISNGTCASSTDDVVITRDDVPTTSLAGSDQSIDCIDFGSLAANTPSVGIGSWSLVSGSGTIVNAADPASAINALGFGANTFEWSISNGVCPASMDQVVITVNQDLTAPVGDVPNLFDVTDECSVTSLTPPTATDNCGGVVNVTNNATLPITAQGPTVVTWTYTDVNGNSSTQTQNVVITDLTAPVPDVANLADENGCFEVTPTAPTATDNCGGVFTATPDVSFPITTAGTTVVTWTYDDGNGNTSSQTQNVVVGTVNVDVTQTGGTLEADQAGATYQWLDCGNGNAAIAGATAQSFTPSAITGNYAVEVNNGGCIDTSACFLVDFTGISDVQHSVSFSVYPNPSTGLFNVVIEDVNKDQITVQVIDALGRLVQAIEVAQVGGKFEQQIDITKEKSGIYFLEVKSGSESLGSLRIVKE